MIFVEYPTCPKLHCLKKQYQSIGKFFDWCWKCKAKSFVLLQWLCRWMKIVLLIEWNYLTILSHGSEYLFLCTIQGKWFQKLQYQSIGLLKFYLWNTYCCQSLDWKSSWMLLRSGSKFPNDRNAIIPMWGSYLLANNWPNPEL